MTNKISLAIVDDEALIISLLKDFLLKQGDFDVLFTCNNGDDIINYLSSEETVTPDIILLDLKMEGKTGVEVTEYLKNHHPDLKIVVMSSHYNKSFTGFMLKTGVSAFIPKGISPTTILSVLREVYKNGFYLMPEQVQIIRNQISAKSPKPKIESGSQLTEREIEVLRYICMQKTAKEIAEKLFISSRTVEGHKNNLLTKTGTKNIAGLVIYSIQNNIINPSEIPII